MLRIRVLVINIEKKKKEKKNESRYYEVRWSIAFFGSQIILQKRGVVDAWYPLYETPRIYVYENSVEYFKHLLYAAESVSFNVYITLMMLVFANTAAFVRSNG